MPHDAIAASRARKPVTTKVPPMTAGPSIDADALRAALARRIGLNTKSLNPERAAELRAG